MAEQSQRQASQQPAEEQSRQRQAGPRSRAALQDLQQPMDPLQRLQALANDSPQVAQLRGLQEIANNSPQAAQLRRLQELANNSPQANEPWQLQAMAQGAERRAEAEPTTKPETGTAKPNLTGLPDHLKSNIEALSGLSMDAVRVHYNSTKPAQLNALAYAQGTDIHLGPGQEQHLPHEAWHVVQQAQGRVRPTLQMAGGVAVNDDAGLEREADVMGGGRDTSNANLMKPRPMSTTNRASASGNQLDPLAVFASQHKQRPVKMIESMPARKSLLFPQVIQLERSENPYKNEGGESTLHGWELSAHHIISHSKLKQALDRLDEDQKKYILNKSVPQIIDDNLKYGLKLENKNLKTKNDDSSELKPTSSGTQKVELSDDDKQTLFEWQGGNLFFGPNSQTRAEESQNKDDIDTDGKYFSDIYDSLKTIDSELTTQLNASESREAIKELLDRMLDLTANKKPTYFNKNNWKEIDTENSLKTISQTRRHIEDYAYFEVETINIGKDKTYSELSLSPGGFKFKLEDGELSAEFNSIVKGTALFIKISETKKKKLEPKPVTIEKFLQENGYNIEKKDKVHILKKNDKVKPDLITVTNYKNNIKASIKIDNVETSLGICKSYIENEKWEFDKIGSDKPINRKTEKTVHDYFRAKRTKVLSYIPEKLFNELCPDEESKEV